MKRFLLFILLLPMYLCVSAQSTQQADLAYRDGNYELAEQLYSQLLSQGYQSSDLYYNLGNTYYRLRRLGPSILNYERALRLDGNHADAQHNLAFVRLQTVDKIEPIPQVFFVRWFQGLQQCLPATTWGILGISCFVLLLLFFLMYVFSTRPALRKTGFSVAMVLLLCTVVFTHLAISRQHSEESCENAIVMVPTLTVKSTPDKSGTDLFVLHEGTKVNIKSSLSGWYEVSTADGNTGWLLANTIEII